MKVPLAGPHKDLFIEPKSEPVEMPPPPPPPQPPPIEPSGMARFLPFFVGFLVIVIVIFFGIRFVSGIFQRSGGSAELTYWGLWEEESVMNTLIEEYKRDHPNITITYQKQNIKQYRETLTNRLSQESGGPDIFRFHNTWVPMLRAFLTPVPSNIYTNEEFESTFYPVVLSDLKVGNSYLGIPLEMDTLALFINEDDFKAAGLSPPKTWDELRSAARQLTVVNSEGKIQKGGVALGTFDNVDHASDIIAFMLLQNGVDMKKVHQSISRDGKNLGGDTLDYYTFFAKGEQKVWDDTLDPSTLAFAKEKVAMYFGYSWRVFEIKAMNPSLKFTIVPAPQLPGRSITFASYWVEGVSKKSRHPKEAFEFLKFLSKAETMQKLFSEQSKLRQFGEPYSRVDLAQSLASNKDAAPFLQLAKDAMSWYLASNTYDNGVNDRMIKYLGDAVRSMYIQNVSAKTALETFAQGIVEVSTQYGL